MAVKKYVAVRLGVIYDSRGDQYINLKILLLNPNPHGGGRICPDCFQRPITQKVLKYKKSVKIIYSTENLCWIYGLGYVTHKKRNFMPVDTCQHP